MKTNKTQKETLKALILAESARVCELLKQLDTDEMNNKYYGDETALIKSELKAKMHELRRDTVRMEKVLQEWG